MKRQIATTVLGMMFALSANAIEIEGVDVPETTTVGDQELVLNGAGVRQKLWIEVYVGALYVAEKSTSVDAILAADSAKRVTMHMLYKVKKKKLVNGWNEGFKNNTDAATFGKLTNQIEAFNAYFDDTKIGDLIVIDLIPGRGTTVTINDKTKGTVAGTDFATAVLNIWLGDEPPTEDLKAAMLGE
ncbi:MAG: chalcone isomerase family protein [Gammaproteobacteria bacterium]